MTGGNTAPEKPKTDKNGGAAPGGGAKPAANTSGKTPGQSNDGQTQTKTAGESNKPVSQNTQVNVIEKKNNSTDPGTKKK